MSGNVDLDSFSSSLLEDKNWLLRASFSDSKTTTVKPFKDDAKWETIGVQLQRSNNIELIDLRNQTGIIATSVEVSRDAEYDNIIGFYAIENANGGIKVNEEIINPGDSRYKQAALQNRITSIDLLQTDNREEFNGTFEGGSIFAPFIIVDGSFNDALNSNAEVYFAYQGANTDKFDHIRLIEDNTFGFEDLPNGGDRDYNDLIIKMELGKASWDKPLATVGYVPTWYGSVKMYLAV